MDRGGVPYHHRDPRVNIVFEPVCLEAAAGTFRIVSPVAKFMLSIKQMVQAAIGQSLESSEDLSGAVVDQGLDVSLVKLEDQLIRSQRGSGNISASGSLANAAFVRTGRLIGDGRGKVPEIALVSVVRNEEGRWNVFVDHINCPSRPAMDRQLLLRCKE